MSKTKTYAIWANMLQRCHNPKNPCFEHYGGRGIKAVKRWHSFERFLADMGEKPDRLTLERQNNNGNYSPANCVWTSHQTQMNNTRVNRLLTANGETLNATQWAARLGICKTAIYWRMKNGWTAQEACTTISTRK